MTIHKNLTSFADQLMQHVLAGDDPVLAVLRQQHKVATLNLNESRYQNSEFLFTYDIDQEAPEINRDLLQRTLDQADDIECEHYHFYISDVYLELEGVSEPIDFHLFLSPTWTQISFLESGPIAATLPERPAIKRMWYGHPKCVDGQIQWQPSDARDMNYVHGVWARLLKGRG